MSDKEQATPDGIAAFAELVEVVTKLRGPQGCSWDIAQTHKSLRRYFLEEACEVLDALDRGDARSLREELGDILIHVLFQCDIASKANEFDLQEVASATAAKLRRRHPHVFADAAVESEEQLENQWESIKRAETGSNSGIKNLPATFPALATAVALQKAAWRAGARWEASEDVEEQLGQMQNGALSEGELENLAGKILMGLSFRIWRAGVDPENALRAAASAFRASLLDLERSHGNGMPLNQLSREQLAAVSKELARKNHFNATRNERP